jgi:heme o synthase
VSRVPQAFALLHPFPSAVNAVLVAGLALLAGADHAGSLALAGGMLGFQFSIGAINDLVDAERDRSHKPGNPVAAGVVSRRAALAASVTGGAIGLAVSAAFGPAVLLLGAAGYGCGILYDVSSVARQHGWLCYAAAFPLLLSWVWVAAASSLPPGWPLLLPVAALAGPALHLSNSLVDRDADARSGVPGLAVRLGHARGIAVLAAVLIVVHAAAWLTLVTEPAPPPALILAATATTTAVVGVALSASSSTSRREAGWRSQAISIGLLAAAWLLAISDRGR